MDTQAHDLPPTLENLATVLRNKDLWPPGFPWDYTRGATCAMGLADIIWGYEATTQMRNLIPDDSFKEIFILQKAGTWPLRHAKKVQPKQVANAIDRYLESHANDNRGNPNSVA